MIHFQEKIKSFLVQVVQEEHEYVVLLWHEKKGINVFASESLSEALKEAIEYVEYAKLYYVLKTLNNLV